MAGMLASQRQAFLREGPSSLKQRKARFAKLRATVLAYRSEVKAAVSADFGHHSPHETDIMEVMCLIQAIDYRDKNLRRFMKPERRHVGIFYRSGRAHVEYLPKGVIVVMVPWNYPFSLTFVPLVALL